MKLLIAVLVLFSVATIVEAKPFLTYTVANVKETSTDVYTVTVDHVKATKLSRGPILPNGTELTLTTKGCLHTPGQNERAVVVEGPQGDSVLFVNGGSCQIVNIEANTKAVTNLK